MGIVVMSKPSIFRGLNVENNIKSILDISTPVKSERQAKLEKLLSDIKKLKPATSKGLFIRKVVISTTMGPGISVKKESLEF